MDAELSNDNVDIENLLQDALKTAISLLEQEKQLFHAVANMFRKQTSISRAEMVEVFSKYLSAEELASFQSVLSGEKRCSPMPA